MSNDEQILLTLQKILESHEQSLALQKQAIAGQQIAIKNQIATGRIYRIVISVAAVVIALFVYRVFHL